MQGVALLLEFEHASVGGAELGLVEGVAEALRSLGNLLVDLLVVLRHLVLDEDVGAITLLAVAVVDERVVERIHVSAGLPRGGVHEDGGIDADDVLVEQHHRLPPVLFDVVLQLHTVLTVVVDSAETIVDITGGEHETVFLAMRNNLLENVFLLCHLLGAALPQFNV